MPEPNELVADYLCSLGTRRQVGGDADESADMDIHAAVRDTIRVLTQRRTPTRRLYCVDFTSRAGDTWSYMVAVDQSDDGAWRICGSSGGSGHGPDRDRPWANLGYSWGNGAVYAAGRVIGAGSEDAARVALDFPDIIVEDDVADGLVAFIAETDEMPVTQRILDNSGSLLAEHPAP